MEPQPFLISSLFTYDDALRDSSAHEKRKSTAKEGKGSEYSYRTVQRIISKAPISGDSLLENVDAEIETCIEDYVHEKQNRGINDVQILWRRVVVRGIGGASNNSSSRTHASFTFPEAPKSNARHQQQYMDEQALSSFHHDPLMCWATFADKTTGEKKQLLCVLSNPSLLRIFDVYPSQDHDTVCGSGGHEIPLPFEARAIFALQQGLLIQRARTMDDVNLEDGGGDQMDDVKMDDDDDFVLADPPQPFRMAGVMDASSTPRASSSIPALFSLTHPLDEILPIASSGSGSADIWVSDILEKVLYVGHPTWMDKEGCPHTQTICVTFHSQLKRHAVWNLKKAPSAPCPPPLWKITREQRNAMSIPSYSATDISAVFDTDVTTIAIEPEEKHFLFDVRTPAVMNRNEALADALGVRNVKPKIEPELSARRGGSGGGGGSGRNNRISLGGHSAAGSVLPSAATSSSPSQTEEQNNHTHTIDFSGDQNLNLPPKIEERAVGANVSFTVSPHAHLHPKICIDLIHHETGQLGNHPAENIFLASTLDGSGKLLLCMVLPVSDDGSDGDPCELRCLSLKVREQQVTTQSYCKGANCIESLVPIMSLSCRSAQPIQAIPVTPGPCSSNIRCRHGIEAMSTDILVCRGSPQNRGSSLSLYRANTHIVDCGVPIVRSDSNKLSSDECKTASFDLWDVVALGHPAGSNVDLMCRNVSEPEKSCVSRGLVSLRLSSSPVAEKALSCIEAALLEECAKSGPSLIPLGLLMRADTVRLCQYLSTTEQNSKTLAYLRDLGWASASTVLQAVVASDLGGRRKQKSTRERIEKEEEAEDSAWIDLLRSDYHREYQTTQGGVLMFSDKFEAASEQKCAVEVSEMQQTLLGESLQRVVASSVEFVDKLKNGRYPRAEGRKPLSTFVFDSMHLLYEECKLSRSMSSLHTIGTFLIEVCMGVRHSENESIMSDFIQHYLKDLDSSLSPDLHISYELHNSFQRTMLSSFSTPPSIFTWIEQLLRDSVNGSQYYSNVEYSDINTLCENSRTVHRLFTLLCGKKGSLEVLQSVRDRAILKAMIEEGIRDSTYFHECLPHGFALPLLEVLHRSRSDPHLAMAKDLPPALYDLVGRSDLNAQSYALKNNYTGTSGLEGGAHFEENSSAKGGDGVELVETASSMLFPNDNRIREAGRVLRSSRPCLLRVERPVEASDHDYERLKQEKLLLLCRRLVSLPLGRGMLTFGGLDPVPAEQMRIPEMSYTGRVPPTNAMVSLDLSDCPLDMNVWPEFHNGVAAGLRLRHRDELCGRRANKITRTWIVYNKPAPRRPPNASPGNSDAEEEPDLAENAHGGFLMALGLQGHLSALAMTDLYDYLTQGNVTTTVGILLGMAANKLGTCDPAVSKMLCLHIPSLLPPTFSLIEVASPAQAAAISGVGLLYLGSSHRLMTEFLLNEIGKRPSSDQSMEDREAYALSCGVALGMINLTYESGKKGSGAKGGGYAGLADLNIPERLLRLMIGSKQDSHAGDEGRRLLNSMSLNNSDQERSSCIYEGLGINTDVTSPGATLALGLMYMRTGNKSIAASLALPDTLFLLEYVRPDLLGLRVIAQSLVLWDDVSPSSEWIANQIPLVVKRGINLIQTRAKQTMDLGNLSGFGSLGITDAADGSHKINNEAHNSEDVAKTEGLEDIHIPEKDCDWQAIRQMYAHVVAGSCFALGLRYVGTGNSKAAAAVAAKIMEFRRLRDEHDPVSMALRPERPVLDMCLACSALGLALIMAGTGDLDTFRLLKILRWRCDDEVRYGTHMAFAAAIGLLFIGGGTRTLGNTPKDIAVLLLSFFPRFPSTTSDNQYHLQALRHMYALAVKKSNLTAVDIDTGEEVFAPVEIDFNSAENPTLKLSVPCNLLNTGGVPRQLRVVSDRFYPLVLDGHSLKQDSFPRTLFVKKRSGFAGEIKDSALATSLVPVQGESTLLDMLSLSGQSTWIRSLATYMGGTMKHNSRHRKGVVEQSQDLDLNDYCFSLVNECTRDGTEEAILPRLSLEVAMRMDTKAKHCQDNLKLISLYYEHGNRFVLDFGNHPKLLRPDCVALLVERSEDTSSTAETSADMEE